MSLSGLRARRNVQGLRPEYLAGLNRCFGGWGDEERYRWCFERRVGALASDMIVLERDGALVAGSAVTYRPLRLAGGASVQAGIMTGAFTLPEERGRGHFTHLVQESRAVAFERGAALLLAFVAETNASCRVLAAAGACMSPTHYVFAPTTGADDARDETLPASEAEASGCREAPAPGGAVRFVYTPDEWESQFLHRPLPVERLSVGGFPALVERSAEMDHVLFSWPQEPALEVQQLAALASRAVRHGRRLRAFTARQALADACAAAGFELRRGRLAILPLSEGASSEHQEWFLHSGDRM